MANLTYFTVIGSYFAAAGDGPYDAGDPSLAAMSGTITITPLVTSGDTIEAPTLTPPTNLYLAPIKVQVKHGRIQVNGEDGVRLVANTSVLNLTGELFYRVEFRDGLVARGVTYPLKSFTFQAPTTDTVVDLVTVTPVAGSTVIENLGGAVTSVAGRYGNVLLVKSDVGLGNVDNTSDVNKPVSTAQAAAINTAVTNLVSGAPGALNTLKELADALGDDANFASTVTALIAAKYTKPSGGIPRTDLSAADQASLGKADTAVGLVQAAKNPDLIVTGAVTLDSSDLVISAAVAWPDGSPGTLTITSRDATGALLAYNITYGSPVTKTFTQPTITRNTNGAATNVPAIVVT